MTPAIIWLIVGVALIAAEVLSGDFVLVMLGLGALAGAGSTLISDNPIIHVIVFAVASTALIVLARPALKRHFLTGPNVRMNTEALLGTQAVTVSTVTSTGGQVKLAGEIWSARSIAEGEVIEPDTTVTVVEISGATAVVSATP
ncbi:NfeD family protein [Saccharomonospora viridis]|jgi:membrane protein implicated in regulation of membrane protease activity|uniref:Membrane protein implicated in regulation of membrane protease activity n=2 Tax=Saccharomonospora viridis TaxID=1852 RepID=C7MV45_SACVD|nr:NfeD family protein [Saccharomonospora viridis]ACU96997.1 membrane protein implicated in regulation of membrane protease activity [Saccharomonospora viridis DSM 43017]KHF43223.1 membrane protein [Saccharomonospora viridis]SFO82571.1 Membrane protein implicated in regulation of membrane protease activity [Saccharomonospora viridis]